MNTKKEVAIANFSVLGQFYKQEIVKCIGDVAEVVDPHAVIMGEVLLLLGDEHPMMYNQPLPTLRQLLTDHTVTMMKDLLLKRAHELIYSELDRCKIPSTSLLKIQPMGGYSLAIMGEVVNGN